ncbi:MAG: S8 family serine peptidase [Ignavibacteriales bacterium]|nr:S8 family serine peptidase [Ignavibacteriales bacterium]
MKNKFLFFYFILLNYLSFSQTTFFIKYKESVSSSNIQKVIEQKDLTLKSNNVLNKSTGISINYLANGTGKGIEVLSKILKVRSNKTLTDDDLRNLQLASSDIEYIQRAHTYKIDMIPNDKFLSLQWALQKIQAFDAWNITQGNDSVIIGVIDTGIDYLHPDLERKIFINSAEDLNHNGILDAGDLNGIDDDGNGFIDDVIGWDFTDRQGFPFDSTGGDYLKWDNNPKDEYGHGTNIAGIISAETDNDIGIAGTAPKIKILNVRAFDPTGNGEEDDVAAAILYAVKMKVKVINMSFGDDSFSLVLQDVIKYANSQNVVLVASAGNSTSDLPHYPSSYSEVISVGASTKEDYVASFSNTGSTIDLIAPGSEIFTTARNNEYENVGGTSAAAPFVSAAAGLILSLKNFSSEEIKQILKSSSDDIAPTGWDLRSGAGRLNLFNALKVLAPSIIKFNYPLQDFATNQDTLKISASILSPYFMHYNLDYGIGYNPQNWNSLLSNQKFQFTDREIYKLNLAGLEDTVYTLRLIVSLSNGRTTEERVNFIVDHTPPKISLISVSPSYYGEKSTILAQVLTDDPSTVRMYYRTKGSSKFNFISLDGFSTNNQFIKKQHYGFIPKDIILSGTDYEIYFEAINLAGLKSLLKDGDKFYQVRTDSYFNLVAEYEQTFSLPPGLIFKDPVNFTNSGYKEIILQELSNSKYPTKIYKYEFGSLVKIDSLINRYPKEFGDFNLDGKWDLLSSLNRTGYVDEQKAIGSTKLENKWVDSSGFFFPILARDIDKDGKTEILSIMKDKTLAVWQVMNDLAVSLEDTLNNFSQNDPLNEFGNNFTYPNAVVTDSDNDGKDEIWTVDQDGDIISFVINGPDNYSDGVVIPTDYNSNNSLITAGDYDGDGKNDIAVLLQSSKNYSIAPFNLLIVFNTLGNKFNVLYEKIFLDPSAEYKSSFQSAESSIRFADIDNDKKNELILFAFPYSYIIKREGGENKIISYMENINSNSIFIGDINSDGVKEIAYPTSAGIKFFEFALPEKPNLPIELTGYSPDSFTVKINWKGSSPLYFIYKGTNEQNINLYDSITSTTYFDRKVLNHANYFYRIVAFDHTIKMEFSDQSKTINVFVHTPARAISAESKSENSVVVKFSDRINPTIENLMSFEIVGKGIPNSITPATQNSYLVSFSQSLTGANNLVIKGLKDFYDSPIQTDTLSFILSPIEKEKEFYITSFELLTSNKIKINFNLEVDESSSSKIENYKFEPTNDVTSIVADKSDLKSIIITSNFPVGSIGKEYKLKINNLFSSASTGKIEINNESGSYILLTSYAKDLNNIFVYPNPVKLYSKNQNVTFANLTKSATITIFNLNGKKIKTLNENNGDGGINWDLINESGEIIDSGIYIYRVAVIDNQNNEGEIKIGKFAVVK